MTQYDFSDFDECMGSGKYCNACREELPAPPDAPRVCAEKSDCVWVPPQDADTDCHLFHTRPVQCVFCGPHYVPEPEPDLDGYRECRQCQSLTPRDTAADTEEVTIDG